MAATKQTGPKAEEVTLIVNYKGCRQHFRFFRSTTVGDALSEIVVRFRLDAPHTKSLIHCGRVMDENSTFGLYEGSTVVQLVTKVELVTSVQTAMAEGIQDHDKYLGFCGSCKLLVKVRPVVNHCQNGEFVFHNTALPDYHSPNPDLTGKCLTCKEKCKANIIFECTSCMERGVAFLRLVRKNTPHVPCMNCGKDEEQVFVFPCASLHCMCISCFANYCQAMMNSNLFSTFPEVGYSINCPGPDRQCMESPVLDPHHFYLVDNKKTFYSDFKEKSAYHMDLPDTSILCLCKNEIDMSYGTEASRTAPVETPQENVAGIGWFRSLIRRFTGPVQAPPTPPPSRGKVSCKQCQRVYCCGCKMPWHEGKCQQITEAMKEQEKFKIEAANAQKGRWPKGV